MRTALLTSFVLLGYIAILFLLGTIVFRCFLRFKRASFYSCWVALVALMAIIPVTYVPGGINDDFANNALMFLPLLVVCLALPFAVFPKPKRYLVMFAVLLSIAVFFGYAGWLGKQRPALSKYSSRIR
jgi:hypothetical protein